jgi:serine/threonine-protein kinase
MAPEDDALAGTSYRILRQLGEGGMGEVYAVEHIVLGKEVVAKILRLELSRDPAVVDRMRVEAQALGALSHPNIVSVTDFGRTADGRPYYIMPLLRGKTVGQMLRQGGPPPLFEAILIARQVLSALSAAHEIGLVHRDIKPDNVFLDEAPDGRTSVKLLDFGVAKVLSASGKGPRPPAVPTAEGAMVGTPRYLSPEQILGRPVDHRSDVYAVGLLLYTLLAGEGPFDRVRDRDQAMQARFTTTPDPPSKLARESVPEALDAAVLKALATKPDERFRSAAEFDEVLGAISRDFVRLLVRSPKPDEAVHVHVPTDPALAATLPTPQDPDARTIETVAPFSDSTPIAQRTREPTEVVAAPGALPSSLLPTRTAPRVGQQEAKPVEVAVTDHGGSVPASSSATERGRLVAGGVGGLFVMVLVLSVTGVTFTWIVLGTIASALIGTALGEIVARIQRARG